MSRFFVLLGGMLLGAALIVGFTYWFPPNGYGTPDDGTAAVADAAAPDTTDAAAPADAAAAPADATVAAGTPDAATPATPAAPAAETTPAATPPTAPAPAGPATVPPPLQLAGAPNANGAVNVAPHYVTDLGHPGEWANLGPNLGTAATPEQVAAVDISIQPDGRNLPAGQGTVAEGAQVYAASCVACHGDAGAGGTGLVQLTGGIGTLTTDHPIKTVASFWPYATTIFDYVRRAMPLNAPRTLTNEQVYAVVAYILSIDTIVPADATMDATTLPAVEMPNRNGFVSYWPVPPANAQL